MVLVPHTIQEVQMLFDHLCTLCASVTLLSLKLTNFADTIAILTVGATNRLYREVTIQFKIEMYGTIFWITL